MITPYALRLLPVFIFSIGVFGYLMPAVGYFDMMPGDLGDARFNSVILEHGYQWLTGRVDRLWSPDFFYPFEGILALSDSHFGTFWVYAVARAFELSREHSFLVWFVTGNVINFWSCYWVLRRFQFGPLAASLGAFVFSFSLPVLHQEGHAQLTYRFAVPLAMWAFWRFLYCRASKQLFQVIFWIGAQFLCSIYLGVFLVYLALAVMISHIVMKSWNKYMGMPSVTFYENAKPVARINWIWAICAIGSVALVLSMLANYYQVAQDYRLSRPLAAIDPLLPRWTSYLLADRSPLSAWLGSRVPIFPMRPEHQMFIGLGALALFFGGIVTVMRSKDRRFNIRETIVRDSALALFFLITATTVFDKYSFYYFLLKIPGLDAVRAVSRIILVMLFPVAIVIAFCVEWVGSRVQKKLAAGLVGVVLILILVTETVGYRPHHSARATWLMRQEGLHNKVSVSDNQGRQIIYVTKKSVEPDYMTELDAMVYAQDRDLKTVNGYSGSTPPGYISPGPCVTAHERLLGYFKLRNSSISEQNALLRQIQTIETEVCQKK